MRPDVRDGSVPAVALVAHDGRKDALRSWCLARAADLACFNLYATGTTGALLETAIPQLTITKLKSGPLGGDQQLGAMIAQGEMDGLIFFVDPLAPQAHDVDVKALIRMATLVNIVFACNEATADAIMPVLLSRVEA